MGYYFETISVTKFSAGMFYFTLETFNLFWLLQRCNDIGVSKWWFCITIIPLTLFYFLFRRGSEQSNQYGPAIPLKDYWEGPVIFGAFLMTIAIKTTTILLIMNESDRFIR
jgi:hypothetical protein